MFKKIIINGLSKVPQSISTSQRSSNINLDIFDDCIREIELEHGRPVTNLSDLKKREDKKKKGDLWEQFCKLWLQSSDKYKNVWFFQEWINYCSETLRDPLGLKTRQDNGIDLIGQLGNGEFVAIQCKYRKDMNKKVTWNTLSTFIGLCERTGPWKEYIVMTNGKGVTRKIPKSKKDKSICIGTFRRTPRIQWLKMTDLYNENKLIDVSENKNDGKEEIITIHEKENDIKHQPLEDKDLINIQKNTFVQKKNIHPSVEKLREIRCKKFI
jgi:predicted helicase